MASPLPQLNRTELSIMKVLWHHGKASAREVHEEISQDFDWAYSTTRTNLERMVRKGLLRKKDFHGLFLYAPGVSKVAALAARVKEFAEQVLELDPAPVVSLFAEGNRLSAEEIEQLERLLDEHSSGPEGAEA